MLLLFVVVVVVVFLVECGFIFVITFELNPGLIVVVPKRFHSEFLFDYFVFCIFYFKTQNAARKSSKYMRNMFWLYVHRVKEGEQGRMHDTNLLGVGLCARTAMCGVGGGRV